MNQDTPQTHGSRKSSLSLILPVAAVIAAAVVCYVAAANKLPVYQASYLLSVVSPAEQAPGAFSSGELQSAIAAATSKQDRDEALAVQYQTAQATRQGNPIVTANISYQGHDQDGPTAAKKAAEQLADTIRQRIADKIASAPKPEPIRDQLYRVDQKLADLQQRSATNSERQRKLLGERTRLLIAFARESVGAEVADATPQAKVKVVRLSQTVRKPLGRWGLIAPAVFAIVFIAAMGLLLVNPQSRSFSGAVEATALLASPAEEVIVKLPSMTSMSQETKNSGEVGVKPRRAA